MSKFKVGDLIKPINCWYEERCGVPEYGLVIDAVAKPTIRSEVKSVLVMWIPHKQNPSQFDHQRFVPHWHLANRMEKVA
jgi:hypothetical protein